MSAPTGGLLVVAATKSGGSSVTFIIFLVLIALVGYFLLLRPQQQKARRQREQQSNVGVGDQVVTVGGIVGRVVAMDGEHVTIVSGEDTVGFAAHGNEPTRLVLVRNAIARKVEPAVVGEPEDQFEHDGYEHDGYEHDGYEHDGYEHDGYEHDGYEHDGYDDEDKPAAGDGRSAEGGGASP